MIGVGGLGNRFGGLGSRRGNLPYPATLNPVLYLSKNNGNFDLSESGGDTYINKWIDPYTGKEATQSTGDYRPQLVEVDGRYEVKFDGVDDQLLLNKANIGLVDNKSFSVSALINNNDDIGNINPILSKNNNNMSIYILDIRV